MPPTLPPSQSITARPPLRALARLYCAERASLSSVCTILCRMRAAVTSPVHCVCDTGAPCFATSHEVDSRHAGLCVLPAAQTEGFPIDQPHCSNIMTQSRGIQQAVVPNFTLSGNRQPSAHSGFPSLAEIAARPDRMCSALSIILLSVYLCILFCREEPSSMCICPRFRTTSTATTTTGPGHWPAPRASDTLAIPLTARSAASALAAAQSCFHSM